jgi:unsaturated chondroitin disaccharide hydrolase
LPTSFLPYPAAHQVAKEHIRPDGTTFHIVEYDWWSGTVIKKYTYQGYADTSTWARGQAWALAGFATLANDTALSNAQRREFTDVAVRLADAWLRLLEASVVPLSPGGRKSAGIAKSASTSYYIPRWDFNAPYEVQSDGPKDSSAAAIAAGGLLRLADALGPGTPCGAKYLAAAQATLRELSSNRYLGGGGSKNSKHEAVLMHAVGNKPANMSVDVGVPYGDYYFISAIRSCRDMEECYSN